MPGINNRIVLQKAAIVFALLIFKSDTRKIETIVKNDTHNTTNHIPNRNQIG